ncbi:hypothetical protein [Bdellovibrio sp.]|uniref:hypothetical protein n=1 Tax=Bdellovibrio sp. TaxID=28201 RepID=UPI0039E2C6F1
MSFLFGLLMMVSSVYAADPTTCPDIVERQDNTQVQMIWSDATNSCFFSVHPMDGYVDLVYRDFLFSTEGLFMVFNSYGPGDESQTTAAREFFMFPRPLSDIKFKWNFDAQELEVTHVTGDKFIFDTRKARLKSISGAASVKVADYVEPGNRGGVEITNYQGLLLDGGFKIGSAPTGNASNSSVMKDSVGKTCSIRNSELFKYTSDGDVIFKYSENTFPAFIKKRCPQLKAP